MVSFDLHFISTCTFDLTPSTVRIKSRAARSKAKLTPAEQQAEDARREAQNVITREKLKEIRPQITYHACPPPRFEGYGAQAEADYLRINPEVAAMYGIDEERVAASFAYEAANPGLRMPWPEFEEEERLTWKQAADGSWYGEAFSPEIHDEDDWAVARQPQERPKPKEKPTGTHFIVHHIIIDHSLDYTQTAHIEMPVEICHWDLFKGGIVTHVGKKAICQSHSEKPYYGVSTRLSPFVQLSTQVLTSHRSSPAAVSASATLAVFKATSTRAHGSMHIFTKTSRCSRHNPARQLMSAPRLPSTARWA